MRNLKLTVEYDGTDFHGWQAQPGVRTAQGVLEKAFRNTFGASLAIAGASRTDAGVHARGQVAHVQLDVPIPTERLKVTLNEKLPSDLFVRTVDEVAPDFHSRFDAVGKHYRYLVRRGDRAGSMLGRYCLTWRHPADMERMQAAAGALVGEFDFASFASRSEPPQENTVRTVHEVRVSSEGAFLRVDVWGRGFLYKMVRTIAGTLLEVGRGRFEPAAMEDILEARNRAAAGPTLPAHGLCLVAVFHDVEAYQRSRSAQSSVLEALLGGEAPAVWRGGRSSN